jgi:RNA polymerase sigma-70 factor, ECF subfamily
VTAGRTIYCVVPRDLAPELHDTLRDHWRNEASVVVVIERRGPDRRRGEPAASTTVRDRRVGDRRGASAIQTPVDLPRKARRHARRLVFVEHMAPSGGKAEDLDTNRVIVRIQAGDAAAFDILYLRYFDRVYAYARMALRDSHEAEDVTQQVFGNIVEALPRYEIRDETPFRSWLFRITRNLVLRTLSRNGRLSPQEPAEIDQRLESPTPEAPLGLSWLSDDDLATQVERLPLGQRQVILLRYVFEFTTNEIADVLERTPMAIRMLEHRATRALEARLIALRGGSGRGFRSSAIRCRGHFPVLSSRRLALHEPGRLPV